jgi:hypothetical protein
VVDENLTEAAFPGSASWNAHGAAEGLDKYRDNVGNVPVGGGMRGCPVETAG